MKRGRRVVLVLAVLTVSALGMGLSIRGERGLKVKVTYTGPGAVDDQHRIHVSVFDTSYIGHAGDAPLATGALAANSETASFADLKKSPVYVFAFFDKAGGYNPASGSYPSGAPAALYGATPGAADPIAIEEGQTVEIQLSFDDSITMP